MTPKQIEKLKSINSDLALENQYLKSDVKLLNSDNKLLRWFLIAMIAMYMVLICVTVGSTATKYNLGTAVLNSGICVEQSAGFVCETDSITFISK